MKKEQETESLENMTGEKMSKIFPQSTVGQSMRWSKFKNSDPREIYEIISKRVFPSLKEMWNGQLPDFDEKTGELIPIPGSPADRAAKARKAAEQGQPQSEEELEEQTEDNGETTAFARYMSDALFLIPTPQVLQKIITGLDDLYEHDISGLDMQGDLYEYMLGKLSTAGQNGQFRTPRHIIKMKVELVQPTPDDTICDPACGTAGFLVAAAEYIREHYENIMTTEQWEHFAGDAFTGFDNRPHHAAHFGHEPDASLPSATPRSTTRTAYPNRTRTATGFTICLANPPFKGHRGCREHPRQPESCHQHQKNRAALSGAVPPNAEKGRSVRLYRS